MLIFHIQRQNGNWNNIPIFIFPTVTQLWWVSEQILLQIPDNWPFAKILPRKPIVQQDFGEWHDVVAFLKQRPQLAYKLQKSHDGDETVLFPLRQSKWTKKAEI